jgi:hypothetical protein
VRANTIAAVVNGLIWLALVWLGWSLLHGVEAQHAHGYPNHGQRTYYLTFPIIMAAFTLALFALARFTRFRTATLFAQVIVFLIVLPFLLSYGGGV